MYENQIVTLEAGQKIRGPVQEIDLDRFAELSGIRRGRQARVGEFRYEDQIVPVERIRGRNTWRLAK